MEDLNIAVDTAYKKRERLMIIGLTGRTGSGCSTVASILKKEHIKNLDIQDVKTYHFNSADERKYRVIRQFMQENDRWKPFVVIEVSSIIISFVLEREISCLIKYLTELVNEKEQYVCNIGDFKKVEDDIVGLEYMFDEIKKYPLADIKDFINLDIDKVSEYYIFYTETIVKFKNRIKEMLSAFSCYEIKKSKLEEKKMIKYHLYTYLMQKFGNNVRSSGEPYDDKFLPNNYYTFISRVNDIIKIVNKYMENLNKESVRICIDAIRSPFEAYYLRDRYRAFYLASITTENSHRVNRLKMNSEELSNLDKIEYPTKTDKPEELFYHQNIQRCLEISDIHIINPNINNSKYYELTEQLLKYIALMLHPGLITPTHIERCMQLAFNAKYNSGCLSRQVGAIVTENDFSVKSVGWNDVPKGQVPCNLRDVKCYCANKDTETFSDYELCDEKFGKVMKTLNEKVSNDKLKGKIFSYCFKDIYNGIQKNKNQVYTRALHAEENAFLQISKYGGQGVKGGKLFTTASPCELCAKKAYQLGISEIYYIDPYPGISQNHILKFGKDNNPKMVLFSGAIGNAYLSLYAPRMPFKDELELVTGICCKDEARDYDSPKQSELGVYDIKYKKVEIVFTFESISRIICTREVEFEVLKDNIKKIDKMMIWTGSSYDGTKLISAEPECIIKESTKKEAHYKYSICYDKNIEKNKLLKYKVQTDLKDEKKIMEPYFSHKIKSKIDELIIRVSAKELLIEDVKGIVYADMLMETKFEEIDLLGTVGLDNMITYEFKKYNPNLFYSYSIEWKFVKQLV